MTITPIKRGEVIGLLKAGVSVRQAAIKADVSKSSVQRIKNNKRKAKAARHKCLTMKQKAILERRNLVKKLVEMRENRDGNQVPVYPNPRRIRDYFWKEKKSNVSSKTITRDLISLGYKNYSRPKRPFRSSSDIQEKRLKFVNSFVRTYKPLFAKNKNVNLYKKIVFTDETFLDTNDYSHPAMWAKSQDKVSAQERLNRYNVPHIMVWAAIGYNYKSPLMLVKKKKKGDPDEVQKRMDHKGYANLLGRSGTIKYCIDKDMLFQHDGARCHVGVHKTYFANKRLKFIFNWPANSPDLNPIENLWKTLKERVAKACKAISDNDELFKVAQQVWADMPMPVINKHVLSFEKKLQKCRRAKGM